MKSLALLIIKIYKNCLSPFLPRACRFLPTCADYAAEAIAEHGVARGGALAVRRICRCHPFGGEGFDPVPPHHKKVSHS